MWVQLRHIGVAMVFNRLGFRYFFLWPALGLPARTPRRPTRRCRPRPGAWQFLRPQFYGEREIGEVDEAFMSIEAPASTPDPAATPVTLHFGQGAVGSIRQVRVIIDNNPSPIASTIAIAPGAAIEQIDLRMRVDRFTSVRAIAETTDGRLEMRSTWIKASGGCSAPPSAAGEGKTGDIRFRASPDGKSLQVSIRHPNHSGFQIDPRSGDPIPPHYVSHIALKADGKPFIDVDSGISLSENPTLRIVSARRSRRRLRSMRPIRRTRISARHGTARDAARRASAAP